MKEEIAQEQAKIEALKQQIAAVTQEKYRIPGIADQDIADAETEISSMRQELQVLV